MMYMTSHRTTRWTAALAMVALAATACQPPSATTPALSEQTYDHWRAELAPSERERGWQEIPWRPVLWDAVREANQRQKPLLVWMINGSPFGCV